MSNHTTEKFMVHGMACTGCEALIEETLCDLYGIFEVKANFTKNQVTIMYDPEKISFEDMQIELKKAGYTLEKVQEELTGKSENRKNKPLSAVQFIGIAVVLLTLYLVISHTIGFNFIPQVTSSMGYGILFVVGLLTSLHCVAMCGGINLSQCVNNHGATGIRGKIKPSLLYNLGRVISYTIIGGMIGAIGSVISFTGWAKGLMAILSGIFMVLMGLSMTGLFPWVNKITPRLPRVFQMKAGSASQSKGPFIVGLLHGLMPCGPLQAMQIYALGTGSFLAGALSMFFFSLGTLPLMFGLGTVITMLGNKFTKNMMKVSAVLVAVLGVVMLGRGLVLSGIHMPTFSSAATVSSDTSTTAKVSTQEGMQNVTSTLTTRGYPTITVQKNIPVVWNLKADARSINGCNQKMIIPQYNIQVTLKEGDNIIKFKPTESGAIPYSCWMGMQTGQINVVDDLKGQSAQAASEEAAASAPVTPALGGMSCCTGSGTLK